MVTVTVGGWGGWSGCPGLCLWRSPRRYGSSLFPGVAADFVPACGAGGVMVQLFSIFLLGVSRPASREKGPAPRMPPD